MYWTHATNVAQCTASKDSSKPFGNGALDRKPSTFLCRSTAASTPQSRGKQCGRTWAKSNTEVACNKDLFPFKSKRISAEMYLEVSFLQNVHLTRAWLMQVEGLLATPAKMTFARKTHLPKHRVGRRVPISMRQGIPVICALFGQTCLTRLWFVSNLGMPLFPFERG